MPYANGIGEVLTTSWRTSRPGITDDECSKRLSLASNGDPVNRALGSLWRGRYLRDGRIDGPLVDACLITEPDKAKELVHAMSLCMYFMVGRIEQIRQRFLWLARNSVDPGEDEACDERAYVPVFAKTSCFGEDNADSQLMEVMAGDYAELDRTVNGRWRTTEIAEYLKRPIEKNAPVLPRKLGRLRLAVFDLDEGLVGSESLLYEVTRDLIRERSNLQPKPTISLNDYAKRVGVSEIKFFSEMMEIYQIPVKNPAELVSEREKRYLSRLQAADRDSLLKPRFRDILDLLRRRNVKRAICSNASNVRLQATLERAGIAMSFTTCVTPDRGMAAKPSPEMLRFLLRELDVHPRDCLVVESSVVGVSAAVAAGCFTILLVNDYTAPDWVKRRGIEVLPNSQALAKWFDAFFAGHS